MASLNQYKLSLPKIWEQDWEQALSSVQGLDRELVLARKQGALLLSGIDETHVTTERLGWMSIWSKVFAALDAVSAALASNSNLSLQLLNRNTFELMLQVHVVIDPVTRRNNKVRAGAKVSRLKDPEEYAFRNTIDRLRAYTAWCLWHDRIYYEEMSNPQNLRHIWNMSASENFRAGESLPEQFKYFLEGLEAEFDEASLSGGDRYIRKILSEKIDKIDEWMLDPNLKRWRLEIERARKAVNGAIPFFFLFDRSDKSIPRRLIKEGLRFGYSAYILSSIISHGSSLGGFMEIDGESIAPETDCTSEEIRQTAAGIIFRCKHLFSLLNIINRDILSRSELRS